MPKFGTLGITAGKGFNGSYIDIKLLIDRRVVLNIEECIIVRGEDGGYFLQDADESCFRPTAEQVDELIALSRRRGSWRRNL